MYKRFRDGVFAPKAVVDYMRDRWYLPFIMLLIYALIITAPMIVSNIANIGLDYTDKNEIKVAMNGDDIPFKIVDYKLAQKGSTSSYVRTINNVTLYIGLEFNSKDLDENPISFFYSGTSTTVVALLSDGVYLYLSDVKTEICQYKEYEELQNLDLSTLGDKNSDNWTPVLNITSELYTKYEKTIVPWTCVLDYFYNFFNILLIALIISLTFVWRFHGLFKYGPMFKMSIYYSAPYIVGYFFTMIFGSSIWQIVGLILSIVYSIIGAGVITKRIVGSRGDKNGL